VIRRMAVCTRQIGLGNGWLASPQWTVASIAPSGGTEGGGLHTRGDWVVPAPTPNPRCGRGLTPTAIIIYSVAALIIMDQIGSVLAVHAFRQHTAVAKQ
jgi:hypothetical protein